MSKIDFSELLMFEKQPLEMLAQDYWRPDDQFAERAKAEIAIRTARAQIDAARYMKWSVIAIAASAVGTVVIQTAAWLWPHPLG